MRVLEYRLKPGEKEPMHSHPAGVVYVLSEGTLKFSYPDGRTEEKAAATGESIWRDPVTHAVENIGKTGAHAIAIDLKTPPQHWPELSLDSSASRTGPSRAQKKLSSLRVQSWRTITASH